MGDFEVATGGGFWVAIRVHILLKSGPGGLSKFMRSLLTGYAVTYNRRHKRHGHVFQNRYKSIICDEDRREDLVGGGLVRTLGGWSQVISMRKRLEKALGDARILAPNEFVERILTEAEEKIAGQISINDRIIEARKAILRACKKEDVSIEALKGGSRRFPLPGLRVQLAKELVTNHGLNMAETARPLGVTTSALWRIFERNK